MLRTETRPGRLVVRALAVTAVALVWATSTHAQAPANATPVKAPAAPATAGQDEESTSVRKALEQKFPGAQISHVGKTGYMGLYEAMLDDTLVYTDPKAAYLFVGSMYDTETKQNLTEARSRKLNRVALDKLPMDLAFKRVKGDGSR